MMKRFSAKMTGTMINGKGYVALGTCSVAIVIAALFTFVLLPQTSSAAFTFTGRDCNGNSICDVITQCDESGCTNSFDNCQSCGTATKVCPNGVVSAPNTCSKSSGSPQCVTATPQCPTAQQLGITDPHVILTFNVFTKKNIAVTIDPPTQTGLAGSTLNYKITMENKNPQQVNLQISSELPRGWSINIPSEALLSANSKKEIAFRVTSNVTSADASYPVIIGVYNSELNLFGTASVVYIVASRGAPTLSVNPKSLTGYPGAALTYNVSVTNNDPENFDPSTVTFSASVPTGFNAVFMPNSIRVSPQVTTYVRLDITSPQNASESNHQITINATMNRLSASDFVEYVIDLCGNTVCEAGEEYVCRVDCPLDPYIICNGRCESQKDDGLQFAASVSIPFNNFVACNRASSLSSCLQAARSGNNEGCGIDKPCICANIQANCDARCVDTTGVYYLAVNGTMNVRTIANYSYSCPYVNLPEIIQLRENFTAAKKDYEKARSALIETLNAGNITPEVRSEKQPCADALTSIIDTTGEFINYLGGVIAWPGIRNTTEARARATTVRANIDSTYNSFCRGATGLLKIQGISAPVVEEGTSTELNVDVDNIGDISYYGYLQCGLTGGQGEISSVNGSCVQIGGRQPQMFSMPFTTTSSGSWSASCSVYGSLDGGCINASLHDQSSGSFSVYTRDTYIVDVSGACGEQLTCVVRASQPECSGCTANGQDCAKISSTNGTDTFRCPKGSYGSYILVGYVLDNDRCRPVTPEQKNITAICTGCGDSIVQNSEQCELPFSNNNNRCSQPQTTCNGKQYGTRDQYGFCTSSCECSLDQYQFSCTTGKCGATCNDGETRTVTLNKTIGICSCVQQCGGSCDWLPCDCEIGFGQVPGPGQVPGIVSTTGVPFVIVNHSQSGSQAALTAAGGNFTKLEIYVDGFVVKTCTTLPCSLTALYNPGTHTYYARASNSEAFATDPTSGLKSFTIAGVVVNGTGGLGVSSVLVDVGHSPASPTANDIVTLTAIAHGPRNFRNVNIYVDGSLRKTCSDSPSSQECTVRSAFSQGTHTYYATALDNNGSAGRDPTSGSKSFFVTAPPPSNATPPDTSQFPSVPGAGTGTGAGTATAARCYAKITEKSCTYNEDTRRYDVFVEASWDNGTHAHANIEDDDGPMIYAKNFTHTRPMAGPGLKTIRVLVHNVNNTNLCFDTADIYCGPGTSAGKDIDIIYDVKDVVGTGTTGVRIVVVPYREIINARLVTYVDNRLGSSDFKVEGNTSLTGVSGPTLVAEDISYRAYTVTTNLQTYTNLSILYNVRADVAGEYRLATIANYSDILVRVNKTLKVTDCPQPNPVLARSPDGATCRDFSTRCDVPPGWIIVESCAPPEPAQQEDSTWLIIVIIVVIIILAVVAYKYRDSLREKFKGLHVTGRGGRPGEEIPSFEER